MHDKDISPVGTSLLRFVKREFAGHPDREAITQIMHDIGLAAKIVSRDVNRHGLLDVRGAIGVQNVQGEDQQKLDFIANIRFKRSLTRGEMVCGVVSEEEEDLIDLQNPYGSFVVAMDPLDGSSNIDVNVSVGAIFGIYKRVSLPGTKPELDDFLRSGKQLFGGGYVIFGSSTMLVYSLGHGVQGFTHDPSLGEFYLSHPDIQIPTDGDIFSVNESESLDFSTGLKNYIDLCKQRRYKTRYTGSLVADFHRNLLRGGVYIYPGTPKTPNGKLRLLYEAQPLAFIAEQAGGMATNGTTRILDIKPDTLHQRTPLFVGSKNMVTEATQLVANHL